MDTLQIKKTDAVNAYNKATVTEKTLLSNLFGKDIFGKITDRIRTFEDACLVTGEDPHDSKFRTGTIDEMAYKKLKVIIRALNENVILDYSNQNQKKWYPWFKFEGSGFRFGGAGYDYTLTNAAGGSRLCLHSEELAEYVGKQFTDLYNQFLN